MLSAGFKYRSVIAPLVSSLYVPSAIWIVVFSKPAGISLSLYLSETTYATPPISNPPSAFKVPTAEPDGADLQFLRVYEPSSDPGTGWRPSVVHSAGDADTGQDPERIRGQDQSDRDSAASGVDGLYSVQ